MENVQESEFGDVRPTPDGSDDLQDDQKCNNIMRVSANQLCAVFCTESDFPAYLVRKFAVIFLRKNMFCSGPTFRSFPS